MTSVIIAAYNEEAVIGRCLDSLRSAVRSRPVQVIVSANGCRDSTAEVAAAHGATVIDRAEPGKVGALNAAERIATSFPRIYLDADIVVPPGGIDDIVEALEAADGRLAAVPRRRMATSGRPLLVRAYFTLNDRLPALRDGLFGRGMIVVTADGRGRFGDFPSLVADDLFLDSLFAQGEKLHVDDVEVVVEAPYSSRELLARLVRVRRGNREMRAAARSGLVETTVRSSDSWAWLREVVSQQPRLVLAAVPYVAITALAEILSRRHAKSWGRDDSTRQPRTGADR